MPGPFYDLTTRLKLRLLKGISEAKDIDAGFHALGEDIDALLSWGVVNAAGAIVAGSGDFTVAKSGTGEYGLKWNTPKSSTYALVVTCEGIRVLAWALLAPTIAEVHTFNLAGASVNSGFYFFAVGA
jgi:hypothetical protein